MAAPVLTSVAMSRNLVACGTEHGRVHVFDTSTGDVVQVLGAHAGHGADGVWGIWLIDGKGGPAEGSMAEAKAASEGPGPSAVPQSPSTYDGPSSRGGDWLEDMVEDEEEDVGVAIIFVEVGVVVVVDVEVEVDEGVEDENSEEEDAEEDDAEEDEDEREREEEGRVRELEEVEFIAARLSPA